MGAEAAEAAPHAAQGGGDAGPAAQLQRERPLGPLGNAARTTDFWGRTLAIYAGYKACQAHALLRAALGWSPERLREEHWAAQHRKAAEQMYALCVDLRGFYLKASGGCWALVAVAPAGCCSHRAGAGWRRQRWCGAYAAPAPAADRRPCTPPHCSQTGQFIGARGDFVPEQICRKLSLLHDQARPLPAERCSWLPLLASATACRGRGISAHAPSACQPAVPYRLAIQLPRPPSKTTAPPLALRRCRRCRRRRRGR